MLRLLGIPPAARVLLGVVLLGVGIVARAIPQMVIGGGVTLISIVSQAGPRGRDRDDTGQRRP